LQFLLGRSM